MDIQMPVMDGHQATLAILKEINKSNSNFNVFKSNEEKIINQSSLAPH